MKLKFFADGQKLSRQGECFVVADSKNYLSAEFLFSQEWKSMTKNAIFKSPDNAYTVTLQDGVCKVPYEVLGGDFTVSVFGTDGDVRITTDYLVVSVEESGYVEGEVPGEPTPTLYEQLLEELALVGEAAESAKNTLLTKADISDLELKADKAETDSHIQNNANPHSVTKEQLGMGNVDNTSDKDKPISDAAKEALLQKADTAELESVSVRAESAWQTATTTADAHGQLVSEYRTYAGANDADKKAIQEQLNSNTRAINAQDSAINEINARHSEDIAIVHEDIAALQGEIAANGANIQNLVEDVGDIEAALDSIIEMQNSLIGGDSV